MSSSITQNTFYLLGPTAVAKSELAVAIAERSGAEIVNADAFQIYARMPILTAWPDAALQARVPHHLLGTIPPSEHCDVARFRAAAMDSIADIRARGKRALVVGGTGLYMRALTRGLAALPTADPVLRAQLEENSLEKLQDMVRELDPRAAEGIDMRNRRRIVRALEVRLLTGESFTTFRNEWSGLLPSGLSGMIVLRPRTELFARIDRRTCAMFAGGVIEEVAQLDDAGATASQAIGYRQIRAFLAGEWTRDECIRHIQQATRRYAKRQMTWLRRETHFAQIELTTPADETALVRRCIAKINGS